MNDQDEVLAEALDWARRGRTVALATVVATTGSSPRPVGARIAVDSDGRFAGSVSSGCVEGEILATAEEAIVSGRHVLRQFGADPEGIWSVALTCGGTLGVLVERLAQIDELQALLDQARAGREAATLLALDDGRRRPLDSATADWDEPSRGARRQSHADRDAVHVAQSLAPMATFAGYDVTVIDPRAAFADPALCRNAARARMA